jgi:hypothetical protein
MSFWKNGGPNVHIAMKFSGAVWMEVVIRGYIMITKVLSADCKTTLAMNAQIMSVRKLLHGLYDSLEVSSLLQYYSTLQIMQRDFSL